MSTAMHEWQDEGKGQVARRSVVRSTYRLLYSVTAACGSNWINSLRNIEVERSAWLSIVSQKMPDHNLIPISAAPRSSPPGSQLTVSCLFPPPLPAPRRWPVPTLQPSPQGRSS
ncbi:hypothetical protein DAEQUDRAFT_233625 [Daedalea quercina L-15889]|uniref:Uncharacterized protein n=1 Tax=Daedalea quercina L-15889 TaxID=1314783 RepID=A0A165QUV2_9APHY|nr:hypothetical protein DAEQUDRAFT_233625 [Daedalea quercina L-15889]